METKSTTVKQDEPQEPDLSRKGMRFLTGGLTSEGDTFVIGVAAVLLMGLLYPVAGAWSATRVRRRSTWSRSACAALRGGATRSASDQS